MIAVILVSKSNFILSMSALSLISLSIKDATNKASEETFGNITNSFTMEINRRVNQGKVKITVLPS